MAHTVTTVIRQCQNSPTVQKMFLPGRQAGSLVMLSGLHCFTDLIISEAPPMSALQTHLHRTVMHSVGWQQLYFTVTWFISLQLEVG